MSKTNRIKRKTTGFDIVYRVVTAIMAIAVFPLAYFQKIVFIVIMHEDISALVDKITNAESSDPGGTYIEWAIADVFNTSSTLHSLINNSDGAITFNSVWENQYLRAVLFSAIFFALTLILALVILGFAIFSNKVKAIIGLSSGGILCMLASWISFSNFFSNPITNDIVPLGEALNIKGVIINLLLGLVDVTTIKLEGAFFSVFFLMLGILIWSVSVLVVNNSEEKEKAMKTAAHKN